MFSWWGSLFTRSKPPSGGLHVPTYASTAQEVVNHRTAETLSAYFAAIRNISEDLGKIPCNIHDIDEDGNKTLAEDHPAYELLSKRPNGMMTALTFKELLSSWALGWGNGFAEIEFDRRMNPVALWPIHPARVQPYISDERELYYYVYPDYDIRGGEVNRLGTPIVLADWQTFHVKGPTEFGVWGKSTLQAMAESMGLSLASQKYGAAFYGNGANQSMVMKHPSNMSQEAAERLTKSIRANTKGAENAQRLLVIEEGMDIVTTTINPKDAQALELRLFQVQEIARWFRIPPHKLQDLSNSAYGGNVESENLSYVTDTLLTWSTRWEQEINLKLILSPGFKSSFDFNFLLKGDRAGRASYYNTMHFMGALNVNEIRKAEGFNSIDEGDTYYQQSAMVPLGEGGEAGASTVQASPPQSGGDDTERAFNHVLMNAAERVATKDAKAMENEAKKQRDHGEWLAKFNGDQKAFAVSSFWPIVNGMHELGVLDGIKTMEAFGYALDALFDRSDLDALTAESLMGTFHESKRKN